MLCSSVPLAVGFTHDSAHMQRRRWHTTAVLLPGKSHGRRSLVGCSPWGREESATTERLHFPFSRSCIGEGSGNPLQCSCPENPRDSGAWWAAIYGVTQGRTRLKRRSSSSSAYMSMPFSHFIPPSPSPLCVHKSTLSVSLFLQIGSSVSNPPFKSTVVLRASNIKLSTHVC